MDEIRKLMGTETSAGFDATDIIDVQDKWFEENAGCTLEMNEDCGEAIVAELESLYLLHDGQFDSLATKEEFKSAIFSAMSAWALDEAK